MARPLRLEYSGAPYHVTSRGNRREVIYEADADRESFLSTLSSVCERFNWRCHAYCLMTNHYHLLFETPDANLSRGIRQLNGVYSQYFNRYHKRVGHVFQGRYRAILIEKQSYLLELARYVVLNPVRTEMVGRAFDWRWSSYRSTAGLVEKPPFLTMDWLLMQFYGSHLDAMQGYRKFVSEGRNQPGPWRNIKNQAFMGGDGFIESLLPLADDATLNDIPISQTRAPAKTLDGYVGCTCSRNEAIAQAYQSGGYTLKELGAYFGLHCSTVSGIVNSPKLKT